MSASVISDLVFSGEKHGYGRSHTEQSDILEKRLIDLYGAHKCIVLPSGMSAITTAIEGILLCLAPNNVTILYDTELYCDTPHAFDMLSMIYTPRISLICSDLSNAKILEETVIDLLQKDQYIIVFAETASNPSGKIFAFNAIHNITQFINKTKLRNHLRYVIDNTWVSSVCCNPFNINPNIDIVVTSLTKYYSGGNAMGGAIMSRASCVMKYIHQWYKTHGIHTSPHDINIINQNIISVTERAKKIGPITMEIMKRLVEKNVKVIHPCLPSHPSYKQTLKYISDAPAVFAIDCECLDTQKIFDAFTKCCPNILIKTSYGGKESRLNPYPDLHQMDDGTKFMRIRIAIGYLEPNVEELVHNILLALDVLNK
jgi:cystathionine beta-lyase/cystathionine gamma-synthase